MPPEGLDWIPGDDLLSVDELVRLVRLAVEPRGCRRSGLREASPLVRRDLEQIIQGVAELPDPPALSLTTNGIGLRKRAASLRAAGLSRINISLDTLDRERFKNLTRRDRLVDVLTGSLEPKRPASNPSKSTRCWMRGINDDEIASLVNWAIEESTVAALRSSRCPLDALQHAWRRGEMIEADEILAALDAAFTRSPSPHHAEANRPIVGRRTP